MKDVPEMVKPKVLLVEDLETYATMLIKKLDGKADITHVTTLREAKEELTKHSFSALITDYNYPEAGGSPMAPQGIKLIQWLRAGDTSNKTIPILFNTNNSGEALFQEVEKNKNVRTTDKYEFSKFHAFIDDVISGKLTSKIDPYLGI